MSRHKRIAAAMVLAAAASVVAAVLFNVGGRESQPARASGPRSPKPERIIRNDPFFGKAIIVRQVDRRRGVIFEITSTPKLRSGGLTIRVTDDAPPETGVSLRSHLLGATCRVPGHDVHEHVGLWDEHLGQFTTSLETDDKSVVIADAATSCKLYVGQPTDTPGTETFLDPPFSRVSMR